MIYEVHPKATFDAIQSDWLDSIRTCADENISLCGWISLWVVIVIAGNKSDMKEQRQVSQAVLMMVVHHK